MLCLMIEILKTIQFGKLSFKADILVCFDWLTSSELLAEAKPQYN